MRRHAGLVLVLACSCLPDAPDALTCPPPATRPLTQCDPNELAREDGGCVDKATTKCLLPDTTDCPSCCSAAGPACFPAGNCPSLVKAVWGEQARCLATSPNTFEANNTCPPLCGCASCASRCDGAGIVVQSGPAATNRLKASELQLGGAGDVGLYVRARGAGDLRLSVDLDVDGGSQDGDSQATELQFEGLPEFSDHLIPGVSKTADKSVTILVRTGSAPTVVEIDCIIPFIVPETSAP